MAKGPENIVGGGAGGSLSPETITPRASKGSASRTNLINDGLGRTPNAMERLNSLVNNAAYLSQHPEKISLGDPTFKFSPAIDGPAYTSDTVAGELKEMLAHKVITPEQYEIRMKDVQKELPITTTHAGLRDIFNHAEQQAAQDIAAAQKIQSPKRVMKYDPAPKPAPKEVKDYIDRMENKAGLTPEQLKHKDNIRTDLQGDLHKAKRRHDASNRLVDIQQETPKKKDSVESNPGLMNGVEQKAKGFLNRRWKAVKDDFSPENSPVRFTIRTSMLSLGVYAFYSPVMSFMANAMNGRSEEDMKQGQSAIGFQLRNVFVHSIMALPALAMIGYALLGPLPGSKGPSI